MGAKTIWLICGNKGGVGKSLLALSLISSLIRLRRSVAALDGDGRTPDVHLACKYKIPSKAVEFRKLQPERHDDMLDGEYEGHIHQLLGVSSDLVINTPDGADDVLMRWFDATLRFTESKDCIFRMIYVMSQREDGLDLLPEMAQKFSFLFPVKNLFFAKPDAFTAFDVHFGNLFREMFTFPRLRDAEVTQLLTGRYLPSEFVETGAGTLLGRQRVIDWLAKMDNMFATMIESEVANTSFVSS